MLGELSQHPMCPHCAHRRRCSHRLPLPDIPRSHPHLDRSSIESNHFSSSLLSIQWGWLRGMSGSGAWWLHLRRSRSVAHRMLRQFSKPTCDKTHASTEILWCQLRTGEDWFFDYEAGDQGRAVVPPHSHQRLSRHQPSGKSPTGLGSSPALALRISYIKPKEIYA